MSIFISSRLVDRQAPIPTGLYYHVPPVSPVVASLSSQGFGIAVDALKAVEVSERSTEFRKVAPGRILLDPADDLKPPPMEVTVFDLVTAIQKMIEEAGEEGVHLIEVDELEVADRETFILDLLEKAGPEGVEFHKLFEGEGPRRLLIVVTFLALLELVRLNLILTAQSALFEEIRITRAVNDDD